MNNLQESKRDFANVACAPSRCKPNERERVGQCLVLLAFATTFWLSFMVFHSQVEASAGTQRVIRGSRLVVQEETEAVSDEALQGEDKYAGGAPLKTDPDLMDRLKKADQFRKDGNYRVAAKLWQSVLGESGDILFSEDKETYYALTEKVESILAELPESGLSSYRIAADAAAREILAQSKSEYDLDVLSRVVKSYFMSSFGDDAAYKLGCIYLDQYDFVGAARLLQKVAEQYPDPSVPLDDVWLRIAIAYAYVGDRESAISAIDNATKAGADPESRLFQSISEL